MKNLLAILASSIFVCCAGCYDYNDDDFAVDGGDSDQDNVDRLKSNGDKNADEKTANEESAEIDPSVCDCLRGLTNPPFSVAGKYCFNIEGDWHNDYWKMTTTVILIPDKTTCWVYLSGDETLLTGFFHGLNLPLKRRHEKRYHIISMTNSEKMIEKSQPFSKC